MISCLNEKVFHFRGLDSDLAAKNFPVPIDQIGNGSTFLAMDTSTLYIYDKANNEWPVFEISGGGGGGGEEPDEYLKRAQVFDGITLKITKKNGTTLLYQPTDNNYTGIAKAKVDAIPTNPKYTDTTYTGDNATIKISSNNQISVMPDVYQTKFTSYKGLSVINNELSVLVDNSTIKINDNGKLSVVNGGMSSGMGIIITTDNKINVDYDSDTMAINSDGKLTIKKDEITTKETISEQTAANNAKAFEEGDTLIARVANSTAEATVGDYIYEEII